jgi:hypothetical protein
VARARPNGLRAISGSAWPSRCSTAPHPSRNARRAWASRARPASPLLGAVVERGRRGISRGRNRSWLKKVPDPLRVVLKYRLHRRHSLSRSASVEFTTYSVMSASSSLIRIRLGGLQPISQHTFESFTTGLIRSRSMILAALKKRSRMSASMQSRLLAASRYEEVACNDPRDSFSTHC